MIHFTTRLDSLVPRQSGKARRSTQLFRAASKDIVAAKKHMRPE